jgi:hypothetical protein
MTVYEIDPTTDERWDDLLQSHPQASIFHTLGWLQALRKTYGYTPVAFTTSAPGSVLTNGIPFCKVTGFFGKQRLISLPFSDHCQPLVQSPEELKHLLGYLEQRQKEEGWQYVEIRPKDSGPIAGTGFEKSQSFLFHKLDLCCSLDEIFRGFHKNCVQRKIRRADRERLEYEEGTSDSLLYGFYRLLVMTRRRHGLPAQPIKWFHNLIACLGTKLTIALASKNGRPVAGMLTLRHKCTLLYKYGCSDDKFNALGGMQLLLWQAIRKAVEDQLWEFDLGRSDTNDVGLVTFKDRWGAVPQPLTYIAFPPQRKAPISVRNERIRRQICSLAPDVLLTASGRLLYRYLG